MERSIEGSYCLACYAEDGSLAGFSRVVTDWATMYYDCDLFVLPQHRGRGLGKELVRRMHPQLRSLSGMLLTADAHGLYAQFGFEQNKASANRFMRKPRPTV